MKENSMLVAHFVLGWRRGLLARAFISLFNVENIQEFIFVCSTSSHYGLWPWSFTSGIKNSVRVGGWVQLEWKRKANLVETIPLGGCETPSLHRFLASFQIPWKQADAHFFFFSKTKTTTPSSLDSGSLQSQKFFQAVVSTIENLCIAITAFGLFSNRKITGYENSSIRLIFASMSWANDLDQFVIFEKKVRRGH